METSTTALDLTSTAPASQPPASGNVETAVKRNTMKALVGIDDSEGSLYALQWVLDNLFNTGESLSPDQSGTLVLLHVRLPFQHFVYPSGPVVYATTAMMDTMKKALEEDSARVLARALEVIYKGRPSVHVKLEPLIVDGDPKEMICEVADKIQPDVVVVGSRGLSKIKRAFLGSVSDYCAHHAHCPVLIVKPPK